MMDPWICLMLIFLFGALFVSPICWLFFALATAGGFITYVIKEKR